MQKNYFKYAIGMLTIAAVIANVQAEKWSFGLMGDTQWQSNLDGENPGTCAVGIIKQIHAQFIGHQVKFVIQAGDLVDKYSSTNGNFNVRAAACADLYAAGIGFFPVRGNHESSADAAKQLPITFPQTTGTGSYTFGANSFTSPFASLEGVSYSFRYNNATFVLIDQFSRKSGSTSGVADQITWIANTLSSRPAATHAFVIAHKNLCGGNHADGLFGSNPSSDATTQNSFYQACASNGVRYFMSGHDHMHLRSLVTSPNRLWNIEQLITSSNSFKFYIPLTGNNINDVKYNNPRRETPLSQEIFAVGYYIYTIDGPIVTVDYYASSNGCNGDCDLKVTPSLSFSKRETWGYSLNGKQFLIPRGGSFSAIRDTAKVLDGNFGTRAAVLGGINTVTGTFYDNRLATSSIATGWRSRSVLGSSVKSDALTLLGMQDSVKRFESDTYTLSLSYDQTAKGPIALHVRNNDGTWASAVYKNNGGKSKFVIGPWKNSYTLGTYGVDPATSTVWAVINHASEFAAVSSVDGDQNGDGIINDTDVATVLSLRGETASIAPEADLDNDGTITIYDARKLALLKN